MEGGTSQESDIPDIDEVSTIQVPGTIVPSTISRRTSLKTNLRHAAAAGMAHAIVVTKPRQHPPTPANTQVLMSRRRRGSLVETSPAADGRTLNIPNLHAEADEPDTSDSTKAKAKRSLEVSIQRMWCHGRTVILMPKHNLQRAYA